MIIILADIELFASADDDDDESRNTSFCLSYVKIFGKPAVVLLTAAKITVFGW